MENSKNLRIASIINGIIGFFLIKVPFYGLLMLITAFILFIISKEEENIKNYKTLLIIMGIILIPFNLISSIFIFMGASDDNNQEINGINAPPVKIKKVMDPEMKKIDMLLKLGVGMVFISGILFATTSWDFISNPVKAISLLILGVIFLGLSIFTENKLKLYKSSFMYWILSMSFFLLTIVGTLYFGLFNDFLTYGGTGSHLAYFITFFTAMGLSFATYLKFPKEYLLLSSYTFLLLLIYNLLAQFITSNALILIVISIVLLLTSLILNKETALYDYNRLIVNLMFPLIIMSDYDKPVLLAILSFINILNQYLIQIKNNNEESYLISTISIYVLIAFAIFQLDLFGDFNYLLVFALMTVHTLLVKFNILNGNENYIKTNYWLYSISSLILFFILEDYSNILGLVLGASYLAMTFFASTDLANSKKIQVAIYFEPVSIIVTILAIFSLDLIPADLINTTMIILLTTMIYCVMNYLRKDEKVKSVYYIATVIGIFAAMETNVADMSNINALITLIPSIYIFINSLNENKLNPEKLSTLICSYLVLLFNLYSILSIVNILDLNMIISSIIFIWILIVFILLLPNDKLKKITYFIIILPLINLIGEFEFKQPYNSIMLSIISLYVLFILLKFFISKPQDKNIFGVVGIVISILIVFGINDPIVGIYIGVVAIGIILIGYYREEFKAFFKTGIIITVLNILYQLWDLWGQIPFWLYLLIGGLGIIGFVTYKELKKSQKK